MFIVEKNLPFPLVNAIRGSRVFRIIIEQFCLKYQGSFCDAAE